MIYIHIPFCRSFCTYCDFYSEIASGCHEDYISALGREIVARSREITQDINTLYIGGGTPSVLPLSMFETIVKSLENVGKGGPYREFTVEVNPDDIVAKGETYVEGLLNLGVNRISMGVQSFDDGILKWMNRRHDSATARKAYAIMEDVGVPDISIDLIFGMPQLSDEMWRNTLESALAISSKGNLPDHISSYQLSVEPGSALAGLVEKGLWSEADEEKCHRQYELLCEVLRKVGYHHYEISNFALPGHEAVHNSAYWKHEPYVGLGPGAHSFILEPGEAPVRRWNLSDLKAYISAASMGDFSSVIGSEKLSDQQIAMEKIMLGLRTSAGVSEDLLKSSSAPESLSNAVTSGYVVRLENGNYRIPETHFFISDSIIAELC